MPVRPAARFAAFLLVFSCVFLLSPGLFAQSRAVLDLENLRVVPAARFPSDVPTCQALVVGGGVGGVAAAETLASQGISVILTEPTSHLGGQFTAQGDALPDENRFIEDENGPSTRRYRELRTSLRQSYAETPGIVEGRASNVGLCWVSRVSGEPNAWERVIRARLTQLSGPRGIRRILLRHQLLSVTRFSGNGQINYADFVDLDTGRIKRIGAQFLLDATETGDVLPLAGSPWTIGQEARAVYGEPDAPPESHPEWVQSFTYCFAVRLASNGPSPIVAKPDDYEFFKSLGAYTLDYDPHGTGPIAYKMFSRAPGAGGPFWSYRRLIAASSFHDNPDYLSDVSLINWSGNDFRDGNFVGATPFEQVRILRRARDFALGFLFWLQTECPRDDGGFGYPEFQPAPDVLGSDGFASEPYVRESRRLLTVSTLTENDLIADPNRPDQKTGTDFFDAVGLALYAIDIHPTRGEPPLLAAALPYSLPLGAFLARSGPSNLIPAAKNIGASRLAAASARVHPTEWLAGEIAGNLAAYCLKNGISPREVRDDSARLTAFQTQLENVGIPTRWRILRTPESQASDASGEMR